MHRRELTACDRGLALALSFFTAGCAAATLGVRPAGGPVPASTTIASRADAAVVSNGPLWRLIAPRELPTPIARVGALRGDAAVVIAGDALFRWEDARAIAICAEFNPPPRALRVDGDHMLALGHGDGRVVTWRSADRGTTCTRVALPPMFVSGSPDAPFAHTLDEDVGIVWSDAGAIAWSGDLGATWRRVADLPGALHVARGPGSQLIAAVSADHGMANGAVVLYSLPNPQAQAWLPIPIAPERRAPIEIRRQPDGTVLVADGLGIFSLTSDGAVRNDVREPAYHSTADAPLALAAAAPGRFVGVTGRTLVEIDARGVRPFAALPTFVPSTIAANVDGTVWFASATQLFRGHVGNGALADITNRPLPEGEPRAIAAQGERLAMITNNRGVAQSANGGAQWSRSELPASAGEPLAAAFGRLGELLVLTSEALFVGEGDAFARSELPEHAVNSSGAAPTLYVTGDRWIVIDGAVLTSDDQGAHWTVRRGRDDASERDAPIVSSVFHGANGLLLDSEHRLWRTDDAASSLQPGTPVDVLATFAMGRPGVAALAWDGARSIAILLRDRVARSSDGGSTWRVNRDPGLDYALARWVQFAPDGRLIAGISSGSCSSRGGVVFAVEARQDQGFELFPNACHVQASALARDGNAFYAATASGSLFRAELDQLLATVR